LQFSKILSEQTDHACMRQNITSYGRKNDKITQSDLEMRSLVSVVLQ